MNLAYEYRHGLEVDEAWNLTQVQYLTAATTSDVTLAGLTSELQSPHCHRNQRCPSPQGPTKTKMNEKVFKNLKS